MDCATIVFDDGSHACWPQLSLHQLLTLGLVVESDDFQSRSSE